MNNELAKLYQSGMVNSSNNIDKMLDNFIDTNNVQCKPYPHPANEYGEGATIWYKNNN